MNLELSNLLPQKSPSKINDIEAREDYDTLIFALKNAYIGIDVIPKEVNDVITRLERSKVEVAPNTSTEKLGEEIGAALSTIPDGHIDVIGNKTSFIREWKRKGSVGKNICSRKDGEVWKLDKVDIASVSVPIIAITHFPDPKDKRWDGIDKALSQLIDENLLIIDLRGNSGGDSRMAIKIAQTLINDTVEHTYKKVVAKQTQASLLLMVNKLKRRKAHYDKSGLCTKSLEKVIEEEERAMLKQEKGLSQPLITQEYKRPDTTDCAFKGRLYILIDSECGSSGEHLVQLLKFHPNTILVGEPTAGLIHFGQQGEFDLPNSAINIRLSTKYFVPFDVEPLEYEKKGLKPDIEVPSGECALKYLANLGKAL